MTKTTDQIPLSELVGGLVSDVSGLFRKEINLAKTEATEKVASALSGIESLMIGLIFAIGAVSVLLAALVSGLAALLVNNGMDDVTAHATSAVVVGLVVGLVAWALISKGLATLRGTNLKLDRTTASLRRDVDVVKENM